MVGPRLPIQEIRRQTNVSRKTIRRLARQPAPSKDRTEEDLPPLPTVPAYRCTCGARVIYDPCRICLTRRASLTSAPADDDPRCYGSEQR